MTAAQRIIKYFALALAAIVIAAIIGGCTLGLYIAGNVTGLIKNDAYVMENAEVISGDTKEVKSLNVELGATNFVIKEGDEFKVETNKSNVTFEDKEGDVTIKENGGSWFNFGANSGGLTIYVPKEFDPFENVVIKNGTGTFTADKIAAKDFKLEVGTGAVKIQELNVSARADIDGGVGKIEILGGKINDLDLDLGVGGTSLKTELTGNSEIDSGVGGLDVTLVGSRKDYEIKADKGIGGINIDGQDVGDDQTIGSGASKVKISGGIGGINVRFEKKPETKKAE